MNPAWSVNYETSAIQPLPGEVMQNDVLLPRQTEVYRHRQAFPMTEAKRKAKIQVLKRRFGCNLNEEIFERSSNAKFRSKQSIQQRADHRRKLVQEKHDALAADGSKWTIFADLNGFDNEEFFNKWKARILAGQLIHEKVSTSFGGIFAQFL